MTLSNSLRRVLALVFAALTLANLAPAPAAASAYGRAAEAAAVADMRALAAGKAERADYFDPYVDGRIKAVMAATRGHGLQLASLTTTSAGRPAGSVTSQFVPFAFLVTQEASPTIPTATIANSPFFDINFDFRCTQAVNGGAVPDKYQTCYNAALVASWSNTPCSSLSSAETMPGANIIWEQGENGGVFRLNVNNAHCPGGALGAPNNNNSANAAYGPSPATDPLDGAWHHARFFGDVSCASASHVRCGGFSIDGVQVVSGIPDTSTDGLGWTGTQTVAFNSAPFFVNAFATSPPVQAANRFQIANFAMDTSVSPVVAGTNTPVNPDSKFTNGGLPVDYGPLCANAYGHQPTLCHRSANFLTDTGTLATDFTITQSVANTVTGQMYAAPSAPGEVPDRPWIRWSYDTKWHPLCANTALTCSVANLNQGNPVLAGDLLCMFQNITFSGSAGNDAFAGTGYTTKIATQNLNSMNHFVGCKVVSGADITAAGAALTAQTWTWANNGSSFAEAEVMLVDFGKYGAGGTTPTVADAQVASAATGSLAYPNATAPSGPSLWVGHTTTFAWQFFAGWSGGPPSTAQLFGKAPGALAGNSPMLAWEKLSASGTVSRTGQESGALGNPTIATVLILN